MGNPPAVRKALVNPVRRPAACCINKEAMAPDPADVSGVPTPLLIVDDDQKLCRLLRDYLQPLGYAVDVAHDGTEGLRLAASGEYAAVILDVMMPGRNGLDVLRELRRRSGVPVLMLTALGDEPDRIAGLELGADDY